MTLLPYQGSNASAMSSAWLRKSRMKVSVFKGWMRFRRDRTGVPRRSAFRIPERHDLHHWYPQRGGTSSAQAAVGVPIKLSGVRENQLTEIDTAISALQDPTRRRILLDFYVHQSEWTVDDVAKAVGVHRTVAHRHLERLVALGYLVTDQRRGKYGKPAKLYRLAGQHIDLSYPARRFARLASLLAESLKERGPEGISAAREAGRRYGISLVSKQADSPRAVLRQLAPLGAEYSLTNQNQVVARNCIFREACDGAEEVVCELHAGLLEGAFRQAGLPLRMEAFFNYQEYGCAYRLS
jgi:predicted ArsR family transcriptional regulator